MEKEIPMQLDLFTRVAGAALLSFALAAPAGAVKPGETVNPNGFPEGEHYT